MGMESQKVHTRGDKHNLNRKIPVTCLWDKMQGPNLSICKSDGTELKIILMLHKLTTIKGLVSNYLGNSEKWLQVDLVAYENGLL